MIGIDSYTTSGEEEPRVGGQFWLLSSLIYSIVITFVNSTIEKWLTEAE